MIAIPVDTLTCRSIYEPSFTWWFPAAGLVLVAVGAGIGLLGKRSVRSIGFVFAGLAMLWVIGSAAMMVSFYSEAKAAAHSPDTPVVEGIVENFKPAPYEGHQDESFDVRGVSFSYSDYVITGGFRQTVSHGGPIRSGVPVRIHYNPNEHNLIVKLEVCTN